MVYSEDFLLGTSVSGRPYPVVVFKDGGGDYQSVQAALDAIPDQNTSLGASTAHPLRNQLSEEETEEYMVENV